MGKEFQIREAVRLKMEQKLQEELKKIREKEEAWKKKLAEEERLKAEREKKKLEMKKKIAEEIEKLKQLEEEKTAKLKLAQSFDPKQPSITPQHEQAPPVPEEPKISLKSK